MNKTRRYILLTVVLIGLLVWVRINQNRSSVSYIEKKYLDVVPNSLTQIIIAKDNEKVVLSNLEQGWVLNEEKTIKPESFTNFFEGLKRLQIMAPVAKKYKNDALAQAAQSGISVTIDFNHSKPLSYRIVFDSLHGSGTYLVLPLKEEAYQVYLPGYLNKDYTHLFPYNTSFWTENALFHFNADSVMAIGLHYPWQTKSSFHLYREEKDWLLEQQGEGAVIVKNVDDEAATKYLYFFQEAKFEEKLEKDEAERHIKKDKVYAVLSMTIAGGEPEQYMFYDYYPTETSTLPDSDKILIFNAERKEYYLSNYISVALVLQKRSHFP